MTFEGFSPETVDFLWGIRLNNDRGWYQEHKEECRRTLTVPMNQLANLALETLEQARPGVPFTCHVSRIFRDARRLYGRGPFKDYLWFTVYDARRGEEDGGLSFWFEIGAEGWSYGLGCYDAPGGFMKRLRDRMTAYPAELLELDAKLAAQKEFSLSGDEYKKQYRDCPVPELARWYCKKNLSVAHRGGIGPELMGPQLADRLAEGYRFLLPFYDYFLPFCAPEAGEEDEE